LTGEHELLDPSIYLSGKPIKLYRISRAKYANLSGIGAALYPGRWNLAGQEAIYTSTNRSTTILEHLVHTPKDQIPLNSAIMEIELRGRWTLAGNHLIDGVTKSRVQIYRSLAEARHPTSGVISTLELGTRPLAVAVPSVVDAQWNVVLFPRAKDFDQHISLNSIEPFQFDPRLFPDNVPSGSG
jgi:RES domain-containing protein